MPLPAFWCGFLCMEQETNDFTIACTLSRMYKKVDYLKFNSVAICCISFKVFRKRKCLLHCVKEHLKL